MFNFNIPLIPAPKIGSTHTVSRISSMDIEGGSNFLSKYTGTYVEFETTDILRSTSNLFPDLGFSSSSHITQETAMKVHRYEGNCYEPI